MTSGEKSLLPEGVAKRLTNMWGTTVEDSPDGLIINIPEELMEKLDWKPGDKVIWEMTPTGFTVRKWE